ncbi:hypothetical protein AGMMS4952_15940 [Spirochaetia bacterium]|nr:hypothetical protein AGMMS4952_15940 [Spirochaetia bacterium]
MYQGSLKVIRKKMAAFIASIALVIVLTGFSPEVVMYGGKILIRNNSTRNLFIELFAEYSGDYSRDTKTIENKIALEKQEQLSIEHSIFEQEYADPNVFYKQIKIYDMDSGALLVELPVNTGTFRLKSGSIGSNNAEFSIAINDELF